MSSSNPLGCSLISKRYCLKVFDNFRQRKQVRDLLRDASPSAYDRIPSLVNEISKVSKPLWDDREKARILRCVRQQSTALIQRLGDVPDECRAFQELCDRCRTATVEGMQDAIKAMALRTLDSVRQTLDTLFFSTAKQPRKVCVVLELSDASEFEFPANHDHVQRWVNAALMKVEAEARGTTGYRVDAFGFPANGSGETFPAVDFPRIGSIPLRAMNSESPCQKRYGRADADSFCVGESMRQRMKDCLEWLSKPEREGRTWRDISGACGYTRREGKKAPVAGVVFAYPSHLDRDPPQLAGLFGLGPGDSDPDGSTFAATAARVIAALDGIVKEHPDVKVRILALAKADKARAKLLVSRQYQARQVVQGATEWQEGCRNVPMVRLDLGTEKTPTWTSLLVPFPGELVASLNTIWVKEGTNAEVSHGLAIGDGISLLLDTGMASQGLVLRSLQLAIVRSTPLLLALGHADHRGDGSFKWNKGNMRYAKQANLVPSILGLLLYKLGFRKGAYMHTAMFLVGQMMSLADTLHKEYCRHVRASRKDATGSGDKAETQGSDSSGLPRQLIGNAAMAVALENPTAGLARLSERILIYQSWANTASGDTGYAGWALAEYREISKKLGPMVLPDRCTDADKAQMLLGYLSRIGSENEVTSNG